ncbi:MAG TPA: J domain-containing protein [Candidatus Limnocylindrales bacterium]|nr:J domain-containing protein [Candidatus Limnocylindrales bacterium]
MHPEPSDPDFVDFYKVLQVDPEADPDVVQAAYRVLARKLHPDLTGDESGMKRLNSAWDTLRDPKRRAAYHLERLERIATTDQAAAAVRGTPASLKTYVEDHAGPPPGNPFGPVVTFGRYEGWSIGEIARVDKPFLEWLRGVPAGRHLVHSIDALIREINGSTGSASRFPDGRLPDHRDLFAASGSR